MSDLPSATSTTATNAIWTSPSALAMKASIIFTVDDIGSSDLDVDSELLRKIICMTSEQIANKLLELIVGLTIFGSYVVYAIQHMADSIVPHDIDVMYVGVVMKAKCISVIRTLACKIKIEQEQEDTRGTYHNCKVIATFIFDDFHGTRFEYNVSIDLIDSTRIDPETLDFTIKALCMTSVCDRMRKYGHPHANRLFTIHYFSRLEPKNPMMLPTIIDLIRRKNCGDLIAKLEPQILSRKNFSGRYAEHNKIMLHHLKIATRHTKMRNLGFVCPALPNFLSSMIVENPQSSCDAAAEHDMCPICMSDNFRGDRHVFQLQCCKKHMCAPCVLAFAKGRADMSKISCPVCRGNPFTWVTTWKTPGESTFATDDFPPFED